MDLFKVLQNTNKHNVLNFISKNRTESFLLLFFIKDWGKSYVIALGIQLHYSLRHVSSFLAM